MAASILLTPIRWALSLVLALVQVGLVAWFAYAAYEIRMYPIKDFGYTIHEFDPWFNYRATEYLAEHGTEKFFKWYDYMSWYPIGRPVGTTIYPGMQISAVAIWEAMKLLPVSSYDIPGEIHAVLGRLLDSMRRRGWYYVPHLPKTIEVRPMTINEICCMIGPWFGALTSFVLGLLAFEVTRSVMAGVFAMGTMAVLPAHLMRSIGGKFDNECVAMVAICNAFFWWLRSVRTPASWPLGVIAGLSYVYMVAVWGGYIFVLNLIGLHAAMLVALGRFNSGVHKAYTIFFIIGTAGALQIPVVGYQPLRSLEQLGPMGVFFGYQILAFCDSQRRKRKMKPPVFFQYRLRALACLAAVLVLIAAVLWPTGYFGPLSSRIRGLFVKHTKTGNPLVDSVAEHQPASSGIYQSYLHSGLDYSFLGFWVLASKRNNAAYFMLLYCFVAVYFSGKMSRLVLICGPVVSVLCGVWIGFVADCLLQPFWLLLGSPGYALPATASSSGAEEASSSSAAEKKNGKAQASAAKKRAATTKQPPKKNVARATTPAALEEWEEEIRYGGMGDIKRAGKANLLNSIGFTEDAQERFREKRADFDSNRNVLLARAAVSLVVLMYLYFVRDWLGVVDAFVDHADAVGRQMGASAQVKYMAQLQNGESIMVDDYWKGYHWIKDNTPEDARVMAWWDYGYQITGIANRTSIADGNTWNHEHIATLGRILTSPQRRAHNAIRHLADYVLVYAGGRADDIAKSPHLARIGNSVFPDHCGDEDPRCNKFGFHNQDRSQPTPMMKKSLLFNLVNHKLKHSGAAADSALFEEVHTTQHGLMRIFKVLNVSEPSKQWIADPANRICDAPGSWYCVGQYPPGISKLIEKRRSFSQVEDFNKKGEKSAYTRLIEKEKGEL